MTTCSICLEDLKAPVSTPCGHLHCEKCLGLAIDSGEDAVNALCPTCRTPFTIAQPDLRFVPAKYHKFIIPSVRRVYFEAGPHDGLGVHSQDLQSKISLLEERVAGLMDDKSLLMDRCEAAMAASANHANKERAARIENVKLRKQVEELKVTVEDSKRKYDGLRGKLKDFKNRLDEPLPTLISPRRSASKRTSTQAALDGTFLTSRGGNFAGHVNDERPIVPMPKRPRIVYRARPSSSDSPDIDQPAPLPPPVFRKRSRHSVHSQEGDMLPGLPESSDTPRRTPAFSTAASTSFSASLPGRSGLPTGDLFSPTRNANDDGNDGHGSIDYDNIESVFQDPSLDRDRKRTFLFRGSKVVPIVARRFFVAGEE